MRSEHSRLRSAACTALLAGSAFNFDVWSQPNTAESLPTATPIKHVLIIVGENRSFDHLFATYVPVHRNERVWNLLSEGIVNDDGSPGPNFAKAYQYEIVSAPNGGRFFTSAGLAQKEVYATLPAPDLNGVGPIPLTAQFLNIPGGDPGLPASDQYLYGTGGTGLSFSYGPDTRISNVNNLPPGPFQLTGPTMPYDAFTADTAHRFFTMVQQMDCAIDAEHISPENPTGCLHDLQSAVTTTYNTPPSATPHDTGQTMGFFNMQNGDAPYFKFLSDTYTMSDNYHQPVFGGTGANSLPLGFAGLVFFSDGNGNPATPPAADIDNPDPQPGTLNLYTHPELWFTCSDSSQPGIAAILNYLKTLPYSLDTRCGPGEYWESENIVPAFTPKGSPQLVPAMPPTRQRSIGDVLSTQNIPWKFYGGAFDVDGTGEPLDRNYCSICNPFEFEAGYPGMVADHMRDVTDLFADLANGTLPAVSYVKPDGSMDGHPGDSKWTLFEAFVRNIIGLAQSNPHQWASTAIFVTVDEGGGFYDSGFIQPVDFFGTGPRIPMIAVSPFSLGGHISHVYNEHSSFVKFVERNWMLHTTLSARSRDNLPEPIQEGLRPVLRAPEGGFGRRRPAAAPSYVPGNMPAIGDLFDLFNFGSDPVRPAAAGTAARVSSGGFGSR